MKKVLVSYRDEGGMPRAFAIGPAEAMEDVKDYAARQLEAYRQKKREVQDFEQADATYTQHVEEFEG